MLYLLGQNFYFDVFSFVGLITLFFFSFSFFLYFVVDIESLDFKFLLKPKYSNTPCVVEEGPNRQLIGGTLQGDARLALFRPNGDDLFEYRVFIKADRVSPFDLAASWRAYQENLRPSAVRGIPDVSIDSEPQTGTEVCFEMFLLIFIDKWLKLSKRTRVPDKTLFFFQLSLLV